jgi:hypothetical protein
MEVGKPPNDVTKRAASYWAWFAVGHVNPKPSIERETNQSIKEAHREITFEFNLRGGRNGS